MSNPRFTKWGLNARRGWVYFAIEFQKHIIMTHSLVQLFMLGAAMLSGTSSQPETPAAPAPPPAEGHIQVSILLDTSNSMDGLIDQAKARLWHIVNTLTTLRFNGAEPDIEIALYEYGNSRLSAQSGYIKQVTPLTRDLDLVSEKLFGLTTNGGDEYCGQVIQEATRKLDWTNSTASMKLIYIAGNEPFTQGKVHYKEAIAEARKKNIFINTIHCGSCEEGVPSKWQDGAHDGKGKYFCINSDERIRFIETPYDKQIADKNHKLNETYIGYGKLAEEKSANQKMQDSNAASYGAANMAERTVSKSGKAYSNDDWDLVDAAKKDPSTIDKLKKEDLPKELQGKSKEEIKKEVEKKSAERSKLQKEIAELAKQREAFIEQEKKKSGTADQDDFGNAVKKSVVELGAKNGFKPAS
jgi:hypothetical protein